MNLTGLPSGGSSGPKNPLSDIAAAIASAKGVSLSPTSGPLSVRAGGPAGAPSAAGGAAAAASPGAAPVLAFAVVGASAGGGSVTVIGAGWPQGSRPSSAAAGSPVIDPSVSAGTVGRGGRPRGGRPRGSRPSSSQHPKLLPLPTDAELAVERFFREDPLWSPGSAGGMSRRGSAAGGVRGSRFAAWEAECRSRLGRRAAALRGEGFAEEVLAARDEFVRLLRSEGLAPEMLAKAPEVSFQLPVLLRFCYKQ